jgi:hypothetical protein
MLIAANRFGSAEQKKFSAAFSGWRSKVLTPRRLANGVNEIVQLTPFSYTIQLHHSAHTIQLTWA